MPLMYARIALVAAILAAGFAGGWMVNGWRLNAKIAPLTVEVGRLKAREVIYEQSNAQCKESVKAANAATDQLLARQKEGAERSKQALKAAQVATANAHTAIATLRATKPPADTGCQAQSDGAKSILLEEVRRRAL